MNRSIEDPIQVQQVIHREAMDYEAIIRKRIFSEAKRAAQVVMHAGPPTVVVSGAAHTTITTSYVTEMSFLPVFIALDQKYPARANIALLQDATAWTPLAPIHLSVIEPISPHADRFKTLRDRWVAETSHISRLDTVYMHPAYQGIIGMGKDALPFIFDEISQPTGRWFWALQAITRYSPFEGQRGISVPQVRDAWLKWGRENGFA